MFKEIDDEKTSLEGKPAMKNLALAVVVFSVHSQ